MRCAAGTSLQATAPHHVCGGPAVLVDGRRDVRGIVAVEVRRGHTLVCPRGVEKSSRERRVQLPSFGNDLPQRPVVVAVIGVRMVQVGPDQVVGVVPVGDGFVAASGSVPVSAIVLGACVLRRARSRVLRTHGDRALLHLAALNPVQVPVVQVVGVTLVGHGDVAAARLMLVGMVRMRLALAHGGHAARCLDHADLHLQATPGDREHQGRAAVLG